MFKSRCYVDISVKNFVSNLQGLKNLVYPKNEKIIGIVKANYYGHGAVKLAHIMEREGISDFAVATLDEGIELREAGIEGTILVLGYVEFEDWQRAHNYDCIITIATVDQAYRMIEFSKNTGIRLKGEVKVDTGMNRIGLNPLTVTERQLKDIYDGRYIEVTGTFSHLCRADSFQERDRKFTYHQKDVFDTYLARLASLGLKPGRRHICASSGILNYPEFTYDAVRPGFMLLGFDVGEVNEAYERKPVLSWYSKVEMVKTIYPEDGVSYGHIYVAGKERKIATISCGYGDGFPRRLSNTSWVLINGMKAYVVGRICMDQFMVDVTGIDVKCEDRVTLIGTSHGVTISANDLANMSDTIVDEIVCDINSRVKRYYIE